VSDFKAHCLQLLDVMAKEGGELLVTKHGEPLARVLPVRASPGTLRGMLRDRLRARGDIVSFDVAGEWESGA
jgi:prevent-host-death family protein